ncbi:Pao retrotransposon peptidase [Popillia japonica]|uniref:Pao retrotransposon peptidase n=1 Tax=Popillia japonica TaxID=7064 RepID=A0AAW1HTS3_POPJA
MLNHLKINRLVLCENAERIELHGFSDASEKAYGGCIYLKSIGRDGTAHVHLLCSKSKVAPLKTVTVPRLELSGLKITPNRLKTFVSNRVAEVQELSAQFTWRHVPSAENPADCLSRGLMPGCIKDAH